MRFLSIFVALSTGSVAMAIDGGLQHSLPSVASHLDARNMQVDFIKRQEGPAEILEFGPGQRTYSSNMALFKPSSTNNTCAGTTFNSQPNWHISPADCEAVIKRLQEVPGVYKVYSNDYFEPQDILFYHYIQVIRSGSCAFEVRPRDKAGLQIGTEDLADIIRDSLRKFESDGGGAEGIVDCESATIAGGRGNIEWALLP